MATPSKAQLLTDVHTLLRRRYKPKLSQPAPRLSVLEAVIYGICHEDATREQANQALSRFKDEFFDWNEIRVSPISEIEETLADIPNPQDRAQRIRRFLRQLFARTYGFNLEPLTKKPLKEALKVLHQYEAFASDYVTATVIQQALGGHAIPIDESARRVLERLGISEPNLATLRAVVERAVPKNRGREFAELLEELAHDTCSPDAPDCPRCELRKLCPHAQAQKLQASPAPQPRRPTAAKVAPSEPSPSPKPKVAPSEPSPSPKPKTAAKPNSRSGPSPLPPKTSAPPPDSHPQNSSKQARGKRGKAP
jgi:endonuclease III